MNIDLTEEAIESAETISQLLLSYAVDPDKNDDVLRNAASYLIDDLRAIRQFFDAAIPELSKKKR